MQDSGHQVNTRTLALTKTSESWSASSSSSSLPRSGGEACILQQAVKGSHNHITAGRAHQTSTMNYEPYKPGGVKLWNLKQCLFSQCRTQKLTVYQFDNCQPSLQPHSSSCNCWCKAQTVRSSPQAKQKPQRAHCSCPLCTVSYDMWRLPCGAATTILKLWDEQCPVHDKYVCPCCMGLVVLTLHPLSNLSNREGEKSPGYLMCNVWIPCHVDKEKTSCMVTVCGLVATRGAHCCGWSSLFPWMATWWCAVTDHLSPANIKKIPEGKKTNRAQAKHQQWLWISEVTPVCFFVKHAPCTLASCLLLVLKQLHPKHTHASWCGFNIKCIAVLS